MGHHKSFSEQSVPIEALSLCKQTPEDGKATWFLTRSEKDPLTSGREWRAVATLERVTRMFRQAECNGTRALRQQEPSLKVNIKSLCAGRCNFSSRKADTWEEDASVLCSLSHSAHCRWDLKMAPEAHNLTLALNIWPLRSSGEGKGAVIQSWKQSAQLSVPPMRLSNWQNLKSQEIMLREGNLHVSAAFQTEPLLILCLCTSVLA